VTGRRDSPARRAAVRPAGLRLAAAAAVVAALAAAAPAPADAASAPRVVCSWRVPLYETPGGLVVGSATRGDRVVVLRRGRTPWVRVRTDWGTRGWLRRGHLC
jgi:hypothetical protein